MASAAYNGFIEKKNKRKKRKNKQLCTLDISYVLPTSNVTST